MHFMKVTFLSFRLIAIPAMAITIFCAALLWMNGSALFLVSLFWTKVITTFLLVGFVYLFRSSGFYFFHNLGLSVRSIILAMILIDWTIALLVFIAIALCL